MKRLGLLLGIMTGWVVSGYGATFTCPTTTAICNGNLYEVSASGLGGNQFAITVKVDTTNYTGGAQEAIGAIAIKSFATGTVVPVSFAATGSSLVNNATWTVLSQELNANGCAGGGSGAFCAETGEVNPYRFVKGNQLSFVFTFTTTGQVDPNLHLKYQFLKGTLKQGVMEYKKEGDLGSFDINLTGRIPTNETVVPEPSTYALLGGALVAIGLLRKRS